MERFIISILVANHSGVLSRVSGMFTRRGFNIDTLTVGETESPEFSRITISMHDDEAICNQIVKQLEKMYDVKKVQVMQRDETVARELLLIKIKNNAAAGHHVSCRCLPCKNHGLFSGSSGH